MGRKMSKHLQPASKKAHNNILGVILSNSWTRVCRNSVHRPWFWDGGVVWRSLIRRHTPYMGSATNLEEVAWGHTSKMYQKYTIPQNIRVIATRREMTRMGLRGMVDVLHQISTTWFCMGSPGRTSTSHSGTWASPLDGLVTVVFMGRVPM